MTVSDAAVAVSATTADTVSVPVTKGSNVKAVYYTTEAVTAYDKDKFLEATESTIVVKKDSTIKLYVEYDNHYTVDTVTINGTDAKSPTKQHCLNSQQMQHLKRARHLALQLLQNTLP